MTNDYNMTGCLRAPPILVSQLERVCTEPHFCGLFHF